MRLRDAKLTQVCPDDAAITADTFLTLSVPCDGVGASFFHGAWPHGATFNGGNEMSERMLSSGSKREDTRAARPSHYWVGIPIFRIPNPGIPAEFSNLGIGGISRTILYR